MIAKNSLYTDKTLLKDVYDEFVNSFGKAAMSMGHKRITGMVFAVLFVSEEPLSLDDITEELETSKATICGTVKDLIKLGFIQKAWVKGSRKDYYVAEKSINVLIQCALQSMLDSRLEATKTFVERIQSKLNQIKDVGVQHEQVGYFQSKVDEIKQLNLTLDQLMSQFTKKSLN